MGELVNNKQIRKYSTPERAINDLGSQMTLVAWRTDCAPRPTASMVDASEAVIGNDMLIERRGEAAFLVVGVEVLCLNRQHMCYYA